MRITKIEILNYLGISAFKSSNLGKLNRITGDNKMGKSAIIKAITEVFKSSGVTTKVIKTGSDKAEILIELDDRIRVERQITAGSNSAKVVVDGQPLNKPQQYLNDLIGKFNFNPVDFFLAKPKERRQILLSSIPFTIDPQVLTDELGERSDIIELSGYDYTKHGLEVLAEIQKTVYDRRHEQNIEVTRLKNSLAQGKLDIPDTFDGEKFADFNIQEKTNELSHYRAIMTQQEADKQRLELLRRRASTIQSQIIDLQKELDEIQGEGKQLAEKVNIFESPDIVTLEQAIKEYHQHQELVHRFKDIKRKETEIETSADVHKVLDDFYKALTTDIPRKLFSQVKLPVDNLEIKGDDIYVGGVSIDTLSTSEQMAFSIEIARSLAGKLKVICVDRFESLGKKAREAFEKKTAADEFEYFVTIVTEGELKMESSGNGGTDKEPSDKDATKPKAKSSKTKPPKQGSLSKDAGF